MAGKEKTKLPNNCWRISILHWQKSSRVWSLICFLTHLVVYSRWIRFSSCNETAGTQYSPALRTKLHSSLWMSKHLIGQSIKNPWKWLDGGIWFYWIYKGKNSHWKMLVFSQVAGWEKTSFLMNFYRNTKLDIEKPSYLFIYLFVYLIIYLFIYLLIYLFICLFIYLFIYLFCKRSS